jgi:hypothetical protein
LGFDTTFFDGGVVVTNIFDEPLAFVQPTPIFPLEKECTFPLPLLALEMSNGFDSNNITIAPIVTTT